MIDYETLKLIWWLLIGLLLIGFALSDGFDMGVGILLPFLGRTDSERRIIINTIGPTWEGNQVWLITAGGAIFAAWPPVYATAFSGFYLAMMVTLFALFFRPVGFDYRSKIEDARWRQTWDWGIFCGSAIPALIFGIAIGNVILGVPFEFNSIMQSTYTGSFFELINPFALLAGLVSVSMLVTHGALYLQIRTEGELLLRAKKTVAIFVPITLTAFILAGIWIITGIEGYQIVNSLESGQTVNIVAKTVVKQSGVWAHNYSAYPWMVGAPVIAIAGAIGALLLSRHQRPHLGFLCNSMSLAGIILTVGFSLFPFILPSVTHPDHSLTVWDATSSHLTLSWMFWVAIIFIPIILGYTVWVYFVLRGKITEQTIKDHSHSLY